MGSLIPFSRHRPPSPMASDVELIPDVGKLPPSSSGHRPAIRPARHRSRPSAAPVKCTRVSIVVFNTTLLRIVGNFICMSIVTFNRMFSFMSGWTLLMWHNKLELTRPRLRTKPEHLKHQSGSSPNRACSTRNVGFPRERERERERALLESANRREQELRASAQQRERETQLQISTLQSQLTLLQHKNKPEQPIPTQGLNGADVAACISQLRPELHAISCDSLNRL